MKRLEKNRELKKGMDIKLAKTNIRESSFNMTRRGGDEDIETRSLKF